MPKTTLEAESRSANWHQSGLEQVTGCPRAWWLEHQLGLPTPGKASAVAGTAYHTAVEFHETCRMQGVECAREDMHAAGLESLDLEIATVPVESVAAVTVKVGKKELNGVDALRHQLATAVDTFWDEDAGEGKTIRETLLQWTPLGLEVYGSAQVVDGARPMAGTIDGLYLDGDGRVVVVDHKTAARVSDWAKGGKGAEQATHYALLVYLDEHLARFSDRLPTATNGGYLPEVHFLVASRTASQRKARMAVHVRCTVTATDLQAAGDRVRAAEQLLTEGLFPANPAYQWCRTCPFRDRCVGGTRELMAPVDVLVSSNRLTG